MLVKDIKALYEAYSQVYAETSDNLITDDLIEEVVEELIDECLEFGYTLEEAIDGVERAAELYFDAQELEEAKVTYGSDTESPEQKTARAKERLGGMKSKARKAAVKSAVSKVKAKAAGAAVSAYVAGKSAKAGAQRAGAAVSTAAKQKKAQVKSGVKKMLGAGLRAVAGGAGAVAQKARKVGSAASKAAERLGEDVENINEITADLGLRASKAADKKRAQLASSGDRPGAAAKAAQAARLYAKQAKRRLKTEDVEIDNWDLVLEFLVSEGYADTNEAALVIMANMSKEEIQAIVNEGFKEIDREKHQRIVKRYDKLGKEALAHARETGEASGDARYKMGKIGDVMRKSAENLRNKG